MCLELGQIFIDLYPSLYSFRTEFCYIPFNDACLGQDLMEEEFTERYERPRVPVVIKGLCDAWPARELWTEEGLLRRFGEHRFKVGFKKFPWISIILILLQFCYVPDAAAKQHLGLKFVAACIDLQRHESLELHSISSIK